MSSVLLTGWPDEVVGADFTVPLIGGRRDRYVYLDNAASTPPLRAVVQEVAEFLPWYSSVHRGAGYKSRLSTAVYEGARSDVERFLAAGPEKVVIFTKGTTEGLNRLARMFGAESATVFISPMEHHANLLPWRRSGCRVEYLTCDADGVLDLDDLDSRVGRADGIRLVALSGAYNVTGYCPPIHEVARIAHRHGAEFLVDGAQLTAHRPVCLDPAVSAECIDYFVCSAHKIYAPFGIGVLVAPRARLAQAEPYAVGGGMADLVTLVGQAWGGLPGREEAGSPNVVGALALGAAVRRLQALGMDTIQEHEEELTRLLRDRLDACPGLTAVPSQTEYDRVGVVIFTTPDVDHELLVARLAYEFGIGVRTGRFCAHPGVLRLLGVSEASAQTALARVITGDHSRLPDAVRVSLGLENTAEDVERLAEALECILDSSEAGPVYERDDVSGELRPEDWVEAWPLPWLSREGNREEVTDERQSC